MVIIGICHWYLCQWGDEQSCVFGTVCENIIRLKALLKNLVRQNLVRPSMIKIKLIEHISHLILGLKHQMGKGSRQTGPMLALWWVLIVKHKYLHIFRPLQLKKYKIMMNVCGLFLQ